VRLFISLFILLNIATVLLTNTQSAFVPADYVRPLEIYGRYTRLLQRWSLFSPEPRRFVQLFFFEILYRDGSKSTWERPMPEVSGFFQREHAYNWQKIDTASNHLEDQHLWPDLGRWAARKFWDEKNPPQTVRLVRRIAAISPPLEDGVWRETRDLKFTEQVVFTYDVASGEAAL